MGERSLDLIKPPPEEKKIRSAGNNKDLLLTAIASRIYELLDNQNIPFLVHCYMINNKEWMRLWTIAQGPKYRGDVERLHGFEDWMNADGYILRKIRRKELDSGAVEYFFYYADIYFNFRFLQKIIRPYESFLYVLTHELLHYIEFLSAEHYPWNEKLEGQYGNPEIIEKCHEFIKKYPDYKTKFEKFMKKRPRNKINRNLKDLIDVTRVHSMEIVIQIKGQTEGLGELRRVMS